QHRVDVSLRVVSHSHNRLPSCTHLSSIQYRHTSSFLLTHPPPPPTHPLSLHDALPISHHPPASFPIACAQHLLVDLADAGHRQRSEEHTSELQSHLNIVCRLLLEKKKK